MAADLRFYNTSGSEIDLNSGFDFGASRKGVGKTIAFKVKNIGSLTAKDVMLISCPLNEQTEVTEAEYYNQVLASKWKAYGLETNGDFANTLNLGNIMPGKFFSGVKDVNIPFSSGTAKWQETWMSQAYSKYNSDNSYTLEKEDTFDLSRNAGRRITHTDVDTTETIHFKFKAKFEYDTSEYNDTAFPGRIFVPVRVNANKDGLGYMFTLIHNRANNKFSVSIMKGTPGIKSFYETNLGTKIFQTADYSLDENKEIEFKIYNDSNGNPNFEVLYDGQNLNLSSSSGSSKIGIDTDPKGYRTKGDFYLDILLGAGDKAVHIKTPKITVDEAEKIIYMKSTITNAGINETTYKSATMLSYYED